jgi:hypothetical protein
MLKKSLFLLLLLLVSGCSQQQSYRYEVAREPRVAWPVSEYEELNKTGSNIISGQGFLKTVGGDVKTCAGNKVLLSPVTSYSKQFTDAIIYKKHGKGSIVLEPETPDRRIYSFLKETRADADGRFKFYDVPDGRYYLYTTVTWSAASGYQGSLRQQGGWVIKQITVNSNNRNEYILTGID